MCLPACTPRAHSPCTWRPLDTALSLCRPARASPRWPRSASRLAWTRGRARSGSRLAWTQGRKRTQRPKRRRPRRQPRRRRLKQSTQACRQFRGKRLRRCRRRLWRHHPRPHRTAGSRRRSAASRRRSRHRRRRSQAAWPRSTPSMSCVPCRALFFIGLERCWKIWKDLGLWANARAA
jgi:hypothetical protein